MMGATLQLGPVGIWSVQFRLPEIADRPARCDRRAPEELGFGTLWIPESGTKAILDVAAELLGSIERRSSSRREY